MLLTLVNTMKLNEIARLIRLRREVKKFETNIASTEWRMLKATNEINNILNNPTIPSEERTSLRIDFEKNALRYHIARADINDSRRALDHILASQNSAVRAVIKILT